MKTSTIKPYALLLCTLLIASCKQELRPLNIIGTWHQTSLTCQLSDCEPIVYDNPAVWTFSPDSTVTITAEEVTDSGTWSLTPDSTLTLNLIRPDGIGVEVRKVTLCTTTDMACQSVSEDEFGDIVETINFIKQE